MDLTGLFNMQLQMFLLMGAGVLLRKLEIIKLGDKAFLSELIVNVLLPCNIVASFCLSFQEETLLAGLSVLAVSVCLQLFCTFLAGVCYNRVPKAQKMVLQYGTVCSNAAFLGNPVAEALYGPLGLIYASLYQIPQRIVMWSAGVSYFTEQPSKGEVFKKVVTHPCIVAVALGIVLMVTGLRPPEFVFKSVKSLGSCTTPITMLFIGAVLAEAGLKQLVSRLTLLYAAIRLVGIPLVTLAGCLLFRVEPTAAGVCVVLAAMPAGSITAILAAKYQGDQVFATSCVVLTTLLSMAVLPLWCLVLNTLF